MNIKNLTFHLKNKLAMSVKNQAKNVDKLSFQSVKILGLEKRTTEITVNEIEYTDFAYDDTNKVLKKL